MNKQTSYLKDGILIPGGIEWTHVPGYTGYTSNPITGCQHNCRFLVNSEWTQCYAKTIAEEGVAQRHYPNGFEHIEFHPEELEKWRSKREPCAIFCDSMADMLGRGVKLEWIQEILAAMRDCPQHIFQLLTKNPARIREFSFPENCWLGVSVPPSGMFGKELALQQQATMYPRWLSFLKDSDAKIRFTSVEPLSWDCVEILHEARAFLNWVIIGAASDGKTIYQPDEGIFSRLLKAMEGVPVFFKGNIDKRLAARNGGWREEFPAIHKAVVEEVA